MAGGEKPEEDEVSWFVQCSAQDPVPLGWLSIGSLCHLPAGSDGAGHSGSFQEAVPPAAELVPGRAPL